jgi:hypothetical protein
MIKLQVARLVISLPLNVDARIRSNRGTARGRFLNGARTLVDGGRCAGRGRVGTLSSMRSRLPAGVLRPIGVRHVPTCLTNYLCRQEIRYTR